ncbi:MAG: hypothetical protein R8N23_09190 [Reichenbachiella sp.]|uniref:tetratricopeptide repeat protein n=1 Tax=Reichenbachiella sp. TaxID=2184521 RepID=UPI002966082E|nr:hypothetical protein [Reichenbachiella sp.]MDW3210030.1 hypothetical protein [Reichenbachiella sp.]
MNNLQYKTEDTLINEGVPLSQTHLWDYQRNYYQEQNINAWVDKVPFYVTSNPYIANSYANIIARYIIDGLNNGNINSNNPLYIVELGAGSGTFSFHFLNKFIELKEKLSIPIKPVYVMTDIIEENIQFWQKQKAFKLFLDAGYLDFSFFDAEISEGLVLTESKITIDVNSHLKPVNPLVLISNYCFDSLRQDVFKVKDSQLFQGLCKITNSSDNFIDEKISKLDQLHLTYDFEKVELPYYKNNVLNDVLYQYTDEIDNQYLLFPVGSLMCIQTFLNISNNNIFLLSSDKGFSKHLDVFQSEEPQLVFHDNCFSLSVNFNAIDRFFKCIGGDGFSQFTEQSLTTCSFVSNTHFNKLPETSLALETNLNSFGHATINSVFLNNDFSRGLTSLNAIIPILEATKWDTWVFNSCRDTIIQQIRMEGAPKCDIENLKEKLPEIEANFYQLPKAIDTFTDIALYLQEIKEYEQALSYYQKSINHFGEIDITFYNMGLCKYFLNKFDEAIPKFELCLKLNPDHILARGWVSQIESILTKQLDLL